MGTLQPKAIIYIHPHHTHHTAFLIQHILNRINEESRVVRSFHVINAKQDREQRAQGLTAHTSWNTFWWRRRNDVIKRKENTLISNESSSGPQRSVQYWLLYIWILYIIYTPKLSNEKHQNTLQNEHSPQKRHTQKITAMQNWKEEAFFSYYKFNNCLKF